MKNHTPHHHRASSGFDAHGGDAHDAGMLDQDQLDERSPDHGPHQPNQHAHSRRPNDAPFRQQKSAYCNLFISLTTVIVVLAVLGVLFLGLGIGALVASNGLTTVKVAYDSCSSGSVCTFSFSVPSNLNSTVYVYRQIDGYYQNHRTYVPSRADMQLQNQGGYNPYSTWTTCTPNTCQGSPCRSPYPCGLVAQSFFVDYYTIKDAASNSVPITTSGIAWASDLSNKFVKLSSTELASAAAAGVTVLVSDVTNENFVVWMRTAAFPSILKLYGTLGSLSAGTYTLTVNASSSYTRSNSGAVRYFMLTTLSGFGGQNSFVGIAYLTTGVVFLVAAISLIVFYCVRSRDSAADLSHLQDLM
eukprot:gnl/Hemi2/14852_TR5039_c0_g1_i1.p1 gnl/Hemi2/14852_TR5039_c0_g1~~gnl/Hemi2/14852_TR5039_c0_g1_i1.p1  ORF type:complete len:358 (+),score=83.99 gnl/Hemi2/14852_TR5039_c0_g1_i1:118-1191(+)